MTSRGLREDPFSNFVEAVASGSDAFVTAQESRGQAALVNSQLLPAEGDWAGLEALGFVKGEPVKGDELFVHATLPEGWVKERTEHSLWSVIKDERGVKRVSIGYKAAFYDRWAQISITNVGGDVATDLIYGDAEVAVPEIWAVLTDTEQVATRERLRRYIAEQEDFISRYGDGDNRYGETLSRAKDALEILGG